MTPEARNVAYLKVQVLRAGGNLRKVSWEGRVGAPDWLVLFPFHHFFVEVKAPGETSRMVQTKEQERLRDAGFIVHEVDCPAAIDALLWVEKRKSERKFKEAKECERSRRARTKS